jgi:hypothetical protein
MSVLEGLKTALFLQKIRSGQIQQKSSQKALKCCVIGKESATFIDWQVGKVYIYTLANLPTYMMADFCPSAGGTAASDWLRN